MMESRIRRLATTLMDATTDADPEVQEQIRESLCALGEAEPEEILSSCQEYLRQHDKLPYPHRALILRSMDSVISNHIHELGKGAAAAAVALASHEMTKSKDSLPEWQGAASAVLVSVGRRFLNKVMEEVLGKFQPGILPHPFVLRTFGDLAAANVFGMVPFLNSILGTLLPMLGMARADSMKIEFCYALQRFSESVQEYLADPERAPDPTIRGDSFGHEFGAAFELLLGTWLPHREHKVRQAAVAALGPMSSLIPKEKLEEQLPKILPGILGLFRKQPEPFPVSKSLCQLLESAVAIGSRSLESQLESLLAALLPQICSPADPEVPTSARNRTELLRCFSVLARAFPERVLEFLLPRLESGNEKIRVGSILVLRHVINSAPSQMEMKKSFILSSMKLPLHDGNTEVRRALVQLISALALHGFLEPPGGEALLHFLVRQCALPAPTAPGIPEADSSAPSLAALRSISVDTLLLLSTTVDGVSHVLWPFLLEFLLPPEFSPALTPLCRSLTFLAAKIREEQRENGPESHGNVPSPHALTARLLTVSSQPFPEGRGSAALRLLRELCPHRALEQLWDTEIPNLLEILRENTEDSLCQQEWEERLLQFLQKSLDSIPDKAWICSLISEISRQLGASDGSQPEKNFLYRCMGTALGACPSKDTVRKELQELLESARYHQEQEREGLAWCFGICARSHLEETLEKLEEFVQSDVFRKSLGLFSLFKERSEAEQERARSSLVLCWGRVAEAAPPEVLSSRLESHVLRNLLRHGHTKVLGIKIETKEPALKLSLIRSVAMISRALAPRDPGNSPGNSGNSPGNCSGNDPGKSPGNGAGIARKAELVALMVEFLRAEPAESLRTRLRQRALGACALLVALEPPLGDPERAELLDTALGSVLGLPPLEFGKSREEPGNEPGQDLLGDALGALTELLRSILRRRLTPHGLQELFAHLGPWIKSPWEQERQRAMAVSNSLLEFYLEKLHVSSVTPFHNLSLLLALLSPRCSDGIPKIRQDAVDCVRSLLYIQLCYQGFSREHRDELLEELRALKEGLGAPDVAVLFHTCTRLASAIGKRIPPEQLPSLLLELFQGLEDPEGNCSRAAAVILNALLRERGGILQEKVPELLSAARARLAAQGEEHVRKAAQQAVFLLGLQHPQGVVCHLLGSPLPFDGPTRAMWRALGAEAALTSQIVEQLLEKLSREVPFKESRAFLLGGGAERVATPLALAATCALDELMSAPEAAAAVLELFPRLFPALLLRLAGSVGVRGPRAAPQPCSCAVGTLKAMLCRAGNDDVVQKVESAGGWELMGIPEQHHDGIALLAGAMAELCGPRIPRIVRSLIPVLGSVFECHRVTCTAFLAELLNHNVVNDLVLLEPLLDALTALEKDPSLLVRVLALRGLGNVASGSPEKVRKHGAQLLASMVSGLDDKDDPQNVVALEAMGSLAKLLEQLQEQDVRSVLLHVAIRIRPFFDSEQAELRRCSIALFGSLARSGRSDCEAFSEQILHALVTLLLHLQDPCPDVVRACKFALRMCAPSVGCEELREMFGNHLREERGLHYGEFLNDVCKFLMRSHPSLLSRLISTNLFYFKSPWRELRAAAAMFVGFLVLHVDEEQGQQVDLDELISALKLLLKDPVPAVRIKVAETLGRLVRLL